MGSVYSGMSNGGALNEPGSPLPTDKKFLPVVGSGEFHVGCADMMVENSRCQSSDVENDASPPDKIPGGLIIRVFYPTAKKRESLNGAIGGTKYPNWKPERDEYVAGIANYQEMTLARMNFFYDWLIGEKRIPAQWQSSLYGHRQNGSMEDLMSEEEQTQDQPQKFPLVIFSHGISGNRYIYSTICTSIASYGYVVAVVEHRDRSASWTYHLAVDPATGSNTKEIPIMMGQFPYKEVDFDERSKQALIRAHELCFALRVMEALNSGQLTEDKENDLRLVWGLDFDWTQFQGRLDTSRAATMGHSFGGASALASTAIRGNLGFKGSVILDGWLFPVEDTLYEHINLPTLFLNATKWQWRENVERMLRLRKLFENKFLFTFKDISHQGFSDFSIAAAGRVGRYFGLQGDLDPELTVTAIVEMSQRFLYNLFHENNDLTLTNEHLQDIATNERFAHFLFEGTDIPVEPANEEINPATA